MQKLSAENQVMDSYLSFQAFRGILNAEKPIEKYQICWYKEITQGGKL